MTTYAERISSTARIARHPIHPMLVPFPIVCFIGALVTDIMYYATAEMMWANFSAWLLLVGVILGILAAIAGLIDFLSNPLIRAASDRQSDSAHTLSLQCDDPHQGCLDFGGADRTHSLDHRRSNPADHRLAGMVDGLSTRRGSH